MLYREIGDAEVGIDDVRLDDRLCRACVETQGTAAAMVRRG